MSNQNSKDAALKWAETQGFHLEMKVARIFENAGFETSLLTHYSDPDTNETREIDVVAMIQKKVEGLTIHIQFFIECKYNKDPWVIFTNRRIKPKPFEYFSHILNGNYHFYNWESQNTFQGRLIACILSKYDCDSIPKTFKVCKHLGFTLKEAHKGNKDAATTAIWQVQKSIFDFEKKNEYHLNQMIVEHENEYEKEYDSAPSKKLNLLIEIPFPLIIYQGPGQLFKAYLDSNDNLDIDEIDQCTIYQAKKPGDLAIGKPVILPIKVLKEDESSYEKIERFAILAGEDINALLSQEKAIMDMWKYENSKVFPKKDESQF